MVVTLGPGKFYGSGLPRPRFYADVKLNDERVDPPLPVMDALMRWAQEAHWSMGGVSFTRHRLQGRIEGNVDKLRAQREKELFTKSKVEKGRGVGSDLARDGNDERVDEAEKSPSPPPAPMAIKRRRIVGLLDEEEDEAQARVRSGPVKKLGDDFERVAMESGMKVRGDGSGSVAEGTRGRRNGADVGVEEKSWKNKRKSVIGGRRVGAAIAAAAAANGLRSSPRLGKRGV